MGVVKESVETIGSTVEQAGGTVRDPLRQNQTFFYLHCSILHSLFVVVFTLETYSIAKVKMVQQH